METYVLKKIITFENGDVVEADVNDASEIREVTKGDALLDILEEDDYCQCHGCGRVFNLQNKKEADEFYSTHTHLFDINCFKVYECGEVGADC